MVDMAVANNNKPMDQLMSPVVLHDITYEYLRKGEQRKSRQAASIVEGLPQYGVGHYPMNIEKQLRCVLCHSRVCWQCKKCLKRLCVEKACFENFDT
ncbi:hypothetical protein HF086_003338 [Spodoptera exigua]|uniref:Uncharacterized protein n=1 Tax=Spodoptera exigua TaxID=7107 RepID=A0A922MY08_SPOEX|nr:hypothetical protein HF086_003338 [Spodoptera exigua]